MCIRDSFFAALKDDKADVLKEARGAPWKRADWPLAAKGDLVKMCIRDR